MDHDAKYWNAINLNPKIGPAKFKKIYTYFKTMKDAWNADSIELLKCGLKEKDINFFLAKKQKISPNREFETILNDKIKIITIRDKRYPKILREIYLPPPLLYVKGKFNTDLSIGVVGTRKFSPYGKEATQSIVKDLALSKITIISGLALGIDALAHYETIKNSGKTIAVLGSGIDWNSIYPSTNRRLAEKIIKAGGAIISEYPCGTLPLKYHFPARNRIIAGLSTAILVIEAPKQSGALITANCALEQNRDVFSIPGNIFSKNSEGTNNLIKMGAVPISSAQDILDELNIKQTLESPENKKITPESPEEEKILSILSQEPLHIDLIKHKTDLDIKTVSSALTMMEIKGKIRNMGNMQYILAHK